MSASPLDPVAAAAAVEVVDKGFANMRARCKRRGITLHVATDPDGKAQFLACRWGWHRAFGTLAEVSAWLERLESKP